MKCHIEVCTHASHEYGQKAAPPPPHTSPVFTAPPPPSLVAAAGKAGAIVGAYGFVYASHSTDSKKTDNGDIIKKYLNILGVISFLGMVLTFLLPETNGKSLEELSGENEKDSEPTPTADRRSRSGPVRLID
ncbi:hypothetical protein Ccrd_018996 [Cynara cardunculus var. scolymus]|uniref:Major facilitator superfamily domain, general substrate transporter n=1 Tax=Cynara cardunculus var. scolymus TaxID=59895 RepID=A0A103Y565_CYNCS|nr:hypothetical protein Ccrd_018996 [Cynara cardunculus var. scolymus]